MEGAHQSLPRSSCTINVRHIYYRLACLFLSRDWSQLFGVVTLCSTPTKTPCLQPFFYYKKWNLHISVYFPFIQGGWDPHVLSVPILSSSSFPTLAEVEEVHERGGGGPTRGRGMSNTLSALTHTLACTYTSSHTVGRWTQTTPWQTKACVHDTGQRQTLCGS